MLQMIAHVLVLGKYNITIINLKIRKMELTKEELALLRGGNYSSEMKTKINGDVLNNNSVGDCKCEYNNFGAVENNNSIKGCSCTCI